MGKLGFAKIHRLSGIFRLCMCLVLVGIIILGAAEGIAAADTAAGLPVIKMFTGDTLTVLDGGHVVYKFEVYNGTKIQIWEAGALLNEYSGPPDNTSKGETPGMTTYQIRKGNMDSYDTILRASNSNGQREQKLKISFATKSKPKTTALIPPVSDNGTGNKNRWGPQTSALSTAATAPVTPRQKPEFFQCPKGCESCLKPDVAAANGLTQKCSEERCYYSPDSQQNWYCYGEPLLLGWFCVDGKVYQGSEADAKQAGATLYATEAEAIKACEQACWCCTNGRYGQTTPDACAKMYGTCFATQAKASEGCLPLGWFCSGNKVYPGTSSQAAQAGATWYATEVEANKACQQPMCWCCKDGTYSYITESACAQTGGKCYANEAQAKELCSLPLGYCCNKNVSATARVTSAYAGVTQTTEPQCMQSGGQWFSNSAAAEIACQSPLGGCCVSGRGATSATQAQCTQIGGKWTTTLAAAQQACDPVGGCCVSGKGATSATQSQCSQMGGKWTTTLAAAQQACQVTYYCCGGNGVITSTTYGRGCFKSREEALGACAPPPPTTYWCCRSGQVYQSTTFGTGCYTSQSQAAANCYVQPKPYVPTPIVPTPRTFVPNVK